MKPYYQDDRCTIYHGDCREVLPTLGRFAALITDPPYGIGFGEYDQHKDKPADYQQIVDIVLSAEKMVVDGGWCVVFQAAKRCKQWHIDFDRDWRLVAYPKTFVQIFKGQGPTWATDYALAWHIGETPMTERGHSRDWRLSETSDMSTRVKGHPCPRPLPQMLHCVDAFTNVDARILDPFLGSGTTLVAAKLEGRQAVGIEISERYCEIAANRLSQGVLF